MTPTHLGRFIVGPNPHKCAAVFIIGVRIHRWWQSWCRLPVIALADAGAPRFRGNKTHLPSKPCQACGRPMTWRRHWAKNWEEVKYCSEACRRAKKPGG